MTGFAARRPVRFFGAFGVALVGAILAAAINDEPHTGVVWTTLACAIVATFALAVQFYADTESYSARSIAAYQMIATWALVLCTLPGATMIVPGTSIRIDLGQSYREYIIALMLPLIVPIAVAIRQLRQKPGRNSLPPLPTPPANLTNFLVLACPFVFGRILSPYLPAGIGYLLRVASAGLVPLCFFAGKAALRDPRVLLVWVAGIGINGAYNLMLGARGTALIPMFFFILGLVLSTGKIRPGTLIVILALLGFPAIYLLGVLGMVRDEIGRDDVRLVSEHTVQQMVTVAKQTGGSGDGLLQSEAFASGLGRLVPWTNVVVPAMTPRILPMRGMAGFDREVAGYLRLFGTSETAVSEAMEANIGNYPANDYGFLVNESTSVEWGVLADGWSRYGWLGGAIAVILVSGVAAGAEAIVRRSRVPTYAKLVGYSIIIVASLRQYTSPTFDVLRFFTLYLVLACPAIFLLDRFLVSFRPVPMRRSNVRRDP